MFQLIFQQIQLQFSENLSEHRAAAIYQYRISTLYGGYLQ